MNHNLIKENIFEANEYPLTNGLKLIEASAGTGKTFSLAHLVLRLITEEECPIERILVVSFTEATASEIKAIIVNRLLLALNYLESNNRNNHQNIDKVLSTWLTKTLSCDEIRLHSINLILQSLEHIDKADITTIHGFCSRTLKREAIEIGSDFNPTLEKDSNKIIREIVNEYWQNEILMIEPNDLSGLINSGLTPDNISKCIANIDSDPSANFDQKIKSLNELEPIKYQFNNLLKVYWHEFIEEWTRNGEELDKDLKIFASYCNDYGIKNTKPYSANPKKDRYLLFCKWLTLIKNTNNNDPPSYHEIRRQKLISDYYHPKVLHKIKRSIEIDFNISPREKLQKAFANIYDSPAEIVWNHAISYTLKALKDKREKQGLISYGDLLKSLDPLKRNKKNGDDISITNDVIMSNLRNRYKVALVDEFQDTDPIQWRILNHAFGDSSEHLLLIVGDPKQAIYRFRGGDLKTYLKAKSIANRVDILIDNYRTTPTLMRSLNNLFSQGFLRSSLQVQCLIPKSKEESSALDKDEYPLQILDLGEEIGRSTKNNIARVSKSIIEGIIPNAIGNYLLELLNKKNQNLTLKDICIIVNRHSQAEDIREGLSTLGISTRLINKGNIFKTEGAKILQHFIECLANPSNYKAIKLIACSPIMQWDLERINNSDTNGELDELTLKFTTLSNGLKEIGLLGCLSQFIEAKTIADISERGALLGDLHQCTQLVEEAMHNQGLSCQGASKWLKQRRLLEIDVFKDEYQPNSDIEEEAVNVITIHRSKGLQFKLVICPYLWEAPPLSNGPLWKESETNKWQISLNNGWDPKRNFVEKEKKETIKEYERLAYVALTRAKTQLTIIWAPANKQEDNPLISLLFGPEAHSLPSEYLNQELMKKWLEKQKIKASIKSITHKSIKLQPKNDFSESILSLGSIPLHPLDKSWGRHSYSSWTKNHNSSKLKELTSPELAEGKDIDQRSEISLPNSDIYQDIGISEKDSAQFTSSQKEGPLKNFPRGAITGNCLHKILQQIDFQKNSNDPSTIAIIKDELTRAGLNISYTNDIQETLNRVLNIPIGGPLNGLKLNQISSKRRIHELSFDLPISQFSSPIKSIDIINIFKDIQEGRFGIDYAKELEDLNIYSKGFLTGSIDLIFSDNENNKNSRWWVLDWKSNWMGNHIEESDSFECGPYHYGQKAMEQQMRLHHYPLQAHIYLTALHRFLKWRLVDYSPELNLGGYIYVFLRGLPDPNSSQKIGKDITTPGIIIEKCPLNRTLEFDRLFKGIRYE